MFSSMSLQETATMFNIMNKVCDTPAYIRGINIQIQLFANMNLIFTLQSLP